MEIHFGRSESYERVVLKNEDYREDYMEWKNEKRLMKARGNYLRQAYLSIIGHKNLTPANSSQLQKVNFTLHTISGPMNERYAHKRRVPLTTYEGEDYLYRDMKQKGWKGRMEK
jgi:hypothetical protein